MRRAIDAFNRDGVEGLLAYTHQDAVIYPIPEWLEDDVYHGHEGLRRVLAWHAAFDHVVWEPLEIRAVGEQVVVHARVVGETKTGGEIHQEFGTVSSRIRHGMAGELRFYRTWSEALEAAEAGEPGTRVEGARRYPGAAGLPRS